MKKRVIFLAFSLLALVFFACDFTMPTAIEVTGSPSVRFAEKVNIGKMFTDVLDEAIKKEAIDDETIDDDDKGKITLFPCSQTTDLTYLIHMDLFTKEFETIENEKDIGKLGFPGMADEIVDVPAPKGGITLIDCYKEDGSKERIVLPLSKINSLLPGFEFSEYKTILYFSGSSLINKSNLDIIIEEVTVENEIEEYEEIKDIENTKNVSIHDKCSDIEKWEADEEYNGMSYPSGGVPINIPISGKNIAISYRVYVPEGEILQMPDDFEAGNVKVEVVIWLPFVFEAVSAEAKIDFPKDKLFSSKDDLFGRDEPDAENMMADIIESLSLEIVLDNNPFKGSDLIVLSGDNIKIKNKLTDNIFPFIISEETMKKINSPENWPFTPNFRIDFPWNEKDKDKNTLRFPREFNAVEFIFKAKIHYRKDF